MGGLLSDLPLGGLDNLPGQHQLISHDSAKLNTIMLPPGSPLVRNASGSPIPQSSYSLKCVFIMFAFEWNNELIKDFYEPEHKRDSCLENATQVKAKREL